jgi:hypothetical protein
LCPSRHINETYRVHPHNPDDENRTLLPHVGQKYRNHKMQQPKDLVPHYENLFAPNKIFSFVSIPAVGTPRVWQDEGTEKPLFQTSLPEFCRFLQKR